MYLPYNINMTFGEKLKEFRTAKGMTQKVLCDLVGLDIGYYSRLENDRYSHTPTTDTLEKLARALGLHDWESDGLHAAAGKIPADVEKILIENPKTMGIVRKRVR